MTLAAAGSRYGRDLIEAVGTGWNLFWFQPRGSRQLALLTRLVGGFALVWLASFSFELTEMFGASGWLSREAVHQAMTDGDVNRPVPGFSHLFLVEVPWGIWATHIAGMLILLLVTLGVAARFSTTAGFMVVLCYIHRAPILANQFETVLCMLFLYLSLGSLQNGFQDRNHSSWISNVVTRLIQVHLCGFYLLIATSKLGSPVWWTGEAVWYLITDTQHRLVAPSVLMTSTFLRNAITHAWLLLELLFPVLIWQRHGRPLMLVLSTVTWIGTAVLTGLVGYSLLMVVANLIFVTRDRQDATVAS